MSVWVGIDEAGYGPLLGPLVVAASVFRVPDNTNEEKLWGLLKECISRKRRRASDQVLVNDSKKVFAGRRIKTLEESVLAFAAVMRKSPETVGQLIENLSMPGFKSLECYPWYNDLDGVPIPIAATRARWVNLTDSLTPLRGDGPCSFLGMRFIAVHPVEFNDMVRHTRNKALVEFQKTGILIRHAWRKYGTEGLMLAIDKQGGRDHYRKLLQDVFPNEKFKVVEEVKNRSVYKADDGRRCAIIVFKSRADSTCLPVALSSMLAKYVREVFMTLFNRYWEGVVPGVKPTAGYYKDAKRFIADVAAVIDKSPDISDLMIRVK